MPKETINDQTQQRWHTEVSWRRKPSRPDDEGAAEGHVQLATVNLDSPFEFPERETDGAWEAGERFDGWRVTLDEAGIDRLIKALHKAKRQAFPPSVDADVIAEAERHHRETADTLADLGRLIDAAPPSARMPRLMSETGDAHDVRDVSTIVDYPQMRCVRPEHEGQPCYVTGEGISTACSHIAVTPGPGVTVESDATAAARLDTEGYRRAREGNR